MSFVNFKKKQKLLALIEQKQDEETSSKSIDELKALLASI